MGSADIPFPIAVAAPLPAVEKVDRSQLSGHITFTNLLISLPGFDSFDIFQTQSFITGSGPTMKTTVLSDGDTVTTTQLPPEFGELTYRVGLELHKNSRKPRQARVHLPECVRLHVVHAAQQWRNRVFCIQ